jgi:hypothetical protein
METDLMSKIINLTHTNQESKKMEREEGGRDKEGGEGEDRHHSCHVLLVLKPGWPPCHPHSST